MNAATLLVSPVPAETAWLRPYTAAPKTAAETTTVTSHAVAPVRRRSTSKRSYRTIARPTAIGTSTTIATRNGVYAALRDAPSASATHPPARSATTTIPASSSHRVCCRVRRVPRQ
jgi:hypothetical protein